MLKLTTLLIEVGLAIALVISFAALPYDPGLDTDGDETMGIAVVIQGRSLANRGTLREAGVRTASRSAEATQVRLFSFLRRTASPLSLLGSPQLIVPLRP